MIKIIFLTIVMLAITMFAVVAVSGLMRWLKNNNSPMLSVPATVVSRRTQVDTHHHGADNGVMYGTSSTTYFVTFEFDTMSRLELSVPYSEAGYMVKGDRGILTFQGTRFISFER